MSEEKRDYKRIRHDTSKALHDYQDQKARGLTVSDDILNDITDHLMDMLEASNEEQCIQRHTEDIIKGHRVA